MAQAIGVEPSVLYEQRAESEYRELLHVVIRVAGGINVCTCEKVTMLDRISERMMDNISGDILTNVKKSQYNNI